jgi:hypothetical protein
MISLKQENNQFLLHFAKDLSNKAQIRSKIFTTKIATKVLPVSEPALSLCSSLFICFNVPTISVQLDGRVVDMCLTMLLSEKLFVDSWNPNA